MEALQENRDAGRREIAQLRTDVRAEARPPTPISSISIAPELSRWSPSAPRSGSQGPDAKDRGSDCYRLSTGPGYRRGLERSAKVELGRASSVALSLASRKWLAAKLVIPPTELVIPAKAENQPA